MKNQHPKRHINRAAVEKSLRELELLFGKKLPDGNEEASRQGLAQMTHKNSQEKP